MQILNVKVQLIFRIFRFLEGERVLCFHGPLIYEAKINKVKEVKVKVPQGADPDATATVVKYFIHYHGWNKNWDEWVRKLSLITALACLVQ